MAANGVDILRTKVSCVCGENKVVVYLIIGEFVLVRSEDVERRGHDRDNYVIEPAMTTLGPFLELCVVSRGPGPSDMKSRGRYQTWGVLLESC